MSYSFWSDADLCGHVSLWEHDLYKSSKENKDEDEKGDEEKTIDIDKKSC